ncbi:MAG: Acyl carrier protein [Desulfovibrio sp.]|uniref:acyl carrier protein n=1 Tax=Christensenella intestinihominis TaxID=1851429 RepID=UPI00082F9A7E|nr:acyl carrier protein [Christensenella intestinihominis]
MVELEKVQQLLAMASPREIEEITPEKHLVSDLEMDSFGLMEVVMAFEDEFGIEIPDRDLRLLDTVEDVLIYLEDKTGPKHMPVRAF